MRLVRRAALKRMNEVLTRVIQKHERVKERRGHGQRDLRAELEERDAIIDMLAEALDAAQYFNAVPLTNKPDSEYAEARQIAKHLARYALGVAGKIPREPADAP